MGIPHPRQSVDTPDSIDLASLALCTPSAASKFARSPSSLKRSVEDISTPPDSASRNPEPDFKRQCTSRSKIYTPPTSPQVRLQPLRITIPHKEPTKEEQRILKVRITYARRWKSKLSRPFPSRSEIRQAYQYKLLRHYTSGLTVPEGNFVKPHINRSPRVDKLRSAFPVLNTSVSSRLKNERLDKYDSPPLPSSPSSAELQLQLNKAITRSKSVRRSAWRNFSSREKDRIDRGREAMLESGLPEEELVKEYNKEPNKLPGWRKKYTSSFAKRLKEEEGDTLTTWD